MVDTGICDPHAGIQGTNRPLDCHVLADENKFSAGELQQLTYWQSYIFARTTRSISGPAAVRYAHLAAFLGRVLVLGNGGDTASVATGSSTGQVLEVMDANPKLHDVMFFV